MNHATCRASYSSGVLLICSLVAALSIGSGSSLEAQAEPVRLTENLCQSCFVQLDSILSLGELDGPGAIGNVFSVARALDGGYFVVHAPDAYHVTAFDSVGAPRARIGRRGEGPGEYNFIRWVRTRGPNLHVFDLALGRHTVLRADHSVQETRPIRFPLQYALADMELLDDTLTVMNAVLASPERVGYALHTISRDGHIALSFAEDPGGYQANAPETLWMRQLQKAVTTEGIWSAHVTRYQIDRWGPDGRLLESVRREAAWFPDHVGDYELDPEALRYLPQIEDIQDDGEGRLWVLIRVPDDRLASAIVPVLEDGQEVAREWTIEDQDLAFDSLIEVIDVRARTVIARIRTDRLFNAFVGHGQLASFSLGADLVPRVSIWSVQIEGGS